MTPLIQVLSIGTMATWLSMSGASSIACLIKVHDHLPALKSEVLFVADDSNVVDLEQMASAGSAAPSEVIDEHAEQTEPIEPLPEPPPVEEVAELPDVPEIEPLPEVPDLPEPKADDLLTEKPKEKPRAEAAKPRTSERPQQNTRPRTREAGATANSGAGTGTGGGLAGGGGSGTTGAARFAGGRMPAPSYPSSCRSAGQEGRVVVVFSVDEQGNVVSVTVKSPAPYPAMNEAAVNAVRRWKFKPGARGSMQRPIVFRLND